MDCIAQDKVTAHPHGTSSNGLRCLVTGGHCQPCDNCDAWREQHTKGLDAQYAEDLQSFEHG